MECDAVLEHDLKQWSLLFHLEKIETLFFVVVLGVKFSQ